MSFGIIISNFNFAFTLTFAFTFAFTFTFALACAFTLAFTHKLICFRSRFIYKPI